MRKKDSRKKKSKAIEPAVKTITEEIKKVENNDEGFNMIEKLVIWNVNSKNEVKFIEKIKKPLQ